MPKAFVDTTIFVDALLNVGAVKSQAKQALRRFDATDAPTYALKELILGAINNFIWFHNKLALHELPEALSALQKMARTPRRYTTATAIQAIIVATDRMSALTPADLAEKYGSAGNVNEITRDRWRLSTKQAVYGAWKNRRKLTSVISMPCPCFKEAPLKDGPRGTIESRHVDCEPDFECAMAPALKGRPDDLRKLRDAVLAGPEKEENSNRARVLKELYRVPKQPMSKSDCRRLGDAVFAFFAPSDAIILTTNVADHGPLAAALGKRVESPVP